MFGTRQSVGPIAPSAGPAVSRWRRIVPTIERCPAAVVEPRQVLLDEMPALGGCPLLRCDANATGTTRTLTGTPEAVERVRLEPPSEGVPASVIVQVSASDDRRLVWYTPIVLSRGANTVFFYRATEVPIARLGVSDARGFATIDFWYHDDVSRQDVFVAATRDGSLWSLSLSGSVSPTILAEPMGIGVPSGMLFVDIAAENELFIDVACQEPGARYLTQIVRFEAFARRLRPPVAVRIESDKDSATIDFDRSTGTLYAGIQGTLFELDSGFQPTREFRVATSYPLQGVETAGGWNAHWGRREGSDDVDRSFAVERGVVVFVNATDSAMTARDPNLPSLEHSIWVARLGANCIEYIGAVNAMGRGSDRNVYDLLTARAIPDYRHVSLAPALDPSRWLRASVGECTGAWGKAHPYSAFAVDTIASP